MAKKYYAHSLEGEPPEKWQPLEKHLKNVAEMARSFTESFSAGDWGYLAGLWHDLGKYSVEFQQRFGATEGTDAHIETKQGCVDHSTAGAQHAFNILRDKRKILAYTIAGHHAGLPNGKANESSDLTSRLKSLTMRERGLKPYLLYILRHFPGVICLLPKDHIPFWDFLAFVSAFLYGETSKPFGNFPLYASAKPDLSNSRFTFL